LLLYRIIRTAQHYTSYRHLLLTGPVGIMTLRPISSFENWFTVFTPADKLRARFGGIGTPEIDVTGLSSNSSVYLW